MARHLYDEQEVNIKGYKLRNMNMIIFAVEVVLAIGLLIGTRMVAGGYETMGEMTGVYKSAQDTVYELERNMDYLTEQARLYVASENRRYLDNYFDNLDERTLRKTVVANFKRTFGTLNYDICKQLDESVEIAEELTEMNLHSMKLMTEYLNIADSLLPEILVKYQLPASEEIYDQEKKKTAAYNMIFGYSYAWKESKMASNYADIHTWLEEYSEQDRANGMAHAKRALHMQSIFTFALVLMMGGMFAFILFMVVNPLHSIIKQIREEKVVELTGPFEIRYLASTYNDMCRVNEASKLELNQQANYDALTGILNRGSFNRLCEFFRGSLQPLVFLLIDVDVFKSINDNYGHDVGDEALRKVARLLKESFREEDYVIRYGGDEFAVIMTGVKPTEKQVIGEKIDEINRQLRHPVEENMPAFSLSVGIAFSPKGYNEEAFQKADKAVYHTKKNGRCGYTFYQDNMVKVDSNV